MIKTLGARLKATLKAWLPERLICRLSIRQSVRKELRSGEPELKILHCLCSRMELAMDVGANRGTYSYLFAKYTDRVLAIEPHPLLVERLKLSLPTSVEVLNFAASDQDGECTFYIPLRAGQDVDSRCSLESDVNKEFAIRTISVKRRRLDNLPIARRNVGVVKIDVEGHELSALQGLAGVVGQCKPTIIVESEARHHSGAPHNVFHFLLRFGYEGYFVHRGNLHMLKEFSLERFQATTDAKPVDGERFPDYVNNFIFIHPSRGAVLDRVKRIFPAPAISSAIDLHAN